MTAPAAPDHLGRPGKKLWDEVVEENEGLGPEDLALLTIACEAWDTVEKMRRRIAKDGLIITPPPHGRPQVHPAEEVRKSAQIRLQSALKQLALGVEPDAPTLPPPGRVVPASRRPGRPHVGTQRTPRRKGAT